MKKELASSIRIKIAASLNKLLRRSEQYKKIENEVDPAATSYALIGLYADIRKATVSDTFNAQSTPSSDTLLLIIKAMGFTLTDFAEVYESLSDSELNDFKKRIDFTKS